MRRGLGGVAVMAVLAASAVTTPVSSAPTTRTPAPSVRVDGDRLVDELGRTVLLRGVNVVDKSPNHWFTNTDGFLSGVVGDEDMAFLAGLGLNSIRLGFTWAAIEPTAPSATGATSDDPIIDAIRH